MGDYFEGTNAATGISLFPGAAPINLAVSRCTAGMIRGRRGRRTSAHVPRRRTLCDAPQALQARGLRDSRKAECGLPHLQTPGCSTVRRPLRCEPPSQASTEGSRSVTAQAQHEPRGPGRPFDRVDAHHSVVRPAQRELDRRRIAIAGRLRCLTFSEKTIASGSALPSRTTATRRKDAIEEREGCKARCRNATQRPDRGAASGL
jgi:hypothetical protein